MKSPLLTLLLLVVSAGGIRYRAITDTYYLPPPGTAYDSSRKVRKAKKEAKAARKAAANAKRVALAKAKADADAATHKELMLDAFSELTPRQIDKLIRISMFKDDIPRIALDIGGVIMSASNTTHEDTDASSGVTDECLDAVKAIVALFGAENVFIISKARTKMADASLAKLHDRNFFKYAGLLIENVYFCKERIQKKPIAESLGITHFVDDRWSVLEHLDPDRTFRYLFPNPRDNSVPRGTKNVHMVDGWSALLAALGISIQA